LNRYGQQVIPGLKLRLFFNVLRRRSQKYNLKMRLSVIGDDHLVRVALLGEEELAVVWKYSGTPVRVRILMFW